MSGTGTKEKLLPENLCITCRLLEQMGRIAWDWVAWWHGRDLILLIMQLSSLLLPPYISRYTTYENKEPVCCIAMWCSSITSRSQKAIMVDIPFIWANNLIRDNKKPFKEMFVLWQVWVCYDRLWRSSSLNKTHSRWSLASANVAHVSNSAMSTYLFSFRSNTAPVEEQEGRIHVMSLSLSCCPRTPKL